MVRKDTSLKEPAITRISRARKQIQTKENDIRQTSPALCFERDERVLGTYDERKIDRWARTASWGSARRAETLMFTFTTSVQCT